MSIGDHVTGSTVVHSDRARPGAENRAHPRRGAVLVAAIVGLGVLCLLSVALGARDLALNQVFTALFSPTGSEADAIVRDLRLPRTVLGVLVGLSLGLAGAVAQALTRNPLADPGLLGISGGASFGIVLSVTTMGLSTASGYIWFAFAGAALASVATYLLGGVGGRDASPIKLAVAGIAVTFLLSSFTSAMVLSDPQALDRYRFWSAGSLVGQDFDTILRILPFVLIGALLALGTGPALNSLALGDDVAASLGHRLRLVRFRGMLAVTLLTGAAVSLAGPLVFVGLVIPHAARLLIGSDHRRLLPTVMLMSPCLLLAADILGRVIARPAEIQVGIISVFIGAPVFVTLVRRRRLTEL